MNKDMAIPTNPAKAGTATAFAELPVCRAASADPEPDGLPAEPPAELPSGVVAVPSGDGLVVDPAVPLLTAGPDGARDCETDFASAW